MPFCKYTPNDLLVAPNSVVAPDYELSADQHASYIYPVDGWRWFDTLDSALVFFAGQPAAQSVNPRQIRHALTRIGLRDAVEAAVAAGDQDIKDWWEFSPSFDRVNEQVAAMGVSLGVTDAQLDDLWALAASL